MVHRGDHGSPARSAIIRPDVKNAGIFYVAKGETAGLPLPLNTKASFCKEAALISSITIKPYPINTKIHNKKSNSKRCA